MKVLTIESTPNPDALKFILDQKLLSSGAHSYDHPAAAKNDPLAEALFELDAVRTVFYMDRFVTVSKMPHVDWNEIQPKIINIVESKAKPVQDEKTSTASSGNQDEILAQINQVLDENIRPALAGDGGGLEVLDYSDYILTVHYQGACGSCPSATAGTLAAIQNLLQRMVDSRIQVVSG